MTGTDTIFDKYQMFYQHFEKLLSSGDWLKYISHIMTADPLYVSLKYK